MTTDELREEIGVQVEKNDHWTDEYVLKLEAECIRLKDIVKNHRDQPRVSPSFLEDMTRQKQYHNEKEEKEGRLGNYELALAHKHRSGAIGDLMIKAISKRQTRYNEFN